MIDDEKIKKAALSYCAKCLNITTRNIDLDKDKCVDLYNGFIDGANWAINEFLKDLWHPNTEEPDKSKSDIITLGFDNDAYLQFKESILWNKESWRHSISRCQIIKWAYLSDILPKEGGEK